MNKSLMEQLYDIREVLEGPIDHIEEQESIDQLISLLTEIIQALESNI